MKKVININFQGRVIPIEESAYEMLQQYIASLRQYFENEEGRDEIINDIENRIAELMGENLKKGAACITDAEVNRIMNSIGRPSDFAEAEVSLGNGPEATGDSKQHQQQQSWQGKQQDEPKRLYRDERDKLLAGVASGLANYLNVDPAIMRVLFVLLAIFGGSGILIYIVLWIVLPSTSLVNSIRKRLYRNPDDRVIAGVCGGLGSYFDINPAIPRIIFAAPFIVGIIASIGRNIFDHDFVWVGGSGGFTFILAYVIMWIILPEARTSSEKLEMRGEKVDLNSIRETVVSDLQDAKTRFAASGKDIGDYAKEKGQMVANDIRYAANSNSGCGHAIAVVFKAFLYLIGGAIALGLFAGLIAIVGGAVGLMPLRDFFLDGQWQYFNAWSVLLLFFGIPLVALLVGLIRRLAGIKTSNKFINWAFSLLWVVGLVSLIFLAAGVNRNFSSQVGKQEDVSIAQPSNNKLYVGLQPSRYLYNDTWLDFDGAIGIDGDTLHLNTIKVSIVKSRDSLYHLHLVKISRGNTREIAQDLAESISFNIVQQDSLLLLPESFAITKDQKWRNQKVVVLIEVPEGKWIEIDDAVSHNYEYFDLDFGRRRSWRIDWNRNWEDTEYWRSNRNMLMTEDGLEWKQKDDWEDDWNDNRPVIIPDSTNKIDSNAVPPAKDSNNNTTIKVTNAAFVETISTPLTLMIRTI